MWRRGSTTSRSSTVRNVHPAAASLAAVLLCCRPVTVANAWITVLTSSSSSSSSSFHASNRIPFQTNTPARSSWRLSSSSSSYYQTRYYCSKKDDDEDDDSNNNNSNNNNNNEEEEEPEEGSLHDDVVVAAAAAASTTHHLPRIYVNTPKLAAQSLITLTPSQTNYINVMRLSNVKRWGPWAGHLRVFNGSNGEWLAKLLLVDSDTTTTNNNNNNNNNNHHHPKKKKNRRRNNNNHNSIRMLECLSMLQEQPPPPTSLKKHTTTVELHMGRIKKSCRKWMLEKVTELGISHIHIVDTELSALQDPWEYDKHLAQVIEAAEQCERFHLPYLSETPNTWEELLATICQDDDDDDDDDDSTTIIEGSSSSSSHHQWFVCRERSPTSQPILQKLQTIPNDCSCVHILVGPEGGWSPQEIDQFIALDETLLNFHFVSLGPLVLRAETAAISAVAAVIMSQDE